MTQAGEYDEPQVGGGRPVGDAAEQPAVDADEPGGESVEAAVAPIEQPPMPQDIEPEDDLEPDESAEILEDLEPASPPDGSAGEEATDEEPTDGAAQSEESVDGEPAEASEDDLEAAIAKANENLEAEPTFDDIAPGTVASSGESTTEPVVEQHRKSPVSIWPFVVYDAIWLLFAGALIWRFEQLPAGTAVFDSPLYTTAVFGGVALTIAGPLLILATWIASWGRSGYSKGAIFVSALLKGAVATTIGVALWWIALMVLDQLRLGRLL